MAIAKKKTKTLKPKKKFSSSKTVTKQVDSVETKTEVAESPSVQSQVPPQSETEDTQEGTVHDMPLSSTNTLEENNLDQAAQPQEESEQIKETSEKKDDESIFSKPPEDVSECKHNNVFIIGVMISSCIIFLLGGFIAGYFFCQNVALRNSVLQEVTGDKVEPTAVPTPTVVAVDLNAYEIQILNGSGTEGVAAKEEGILTSEGFNVVAIGNASSSTISKTEISAKKEVLPQFLNKLQEALSVNYEVSDSVGTLSDNDGFDVIVTIGSSVSSDQ